MTHTIDDIRRAWLAAALDQWSIDIRDKNDSPEIVGYFQDVGWGWHVANGYRDTAKFAWCGIFQAWCALQVGDYLDAGTCANVFVDRDVARMCLPSTRRIAKSSKWSAAGAPMPTVYRPGALRGQWLRPNGTRIEQDNVLVPGALVTIASHEYGDYRDELGGHFVLIENATDTHIETVEGNGIGELGDGRWGEGVVRRRGEHARPHHHIRRVYHLDLDHFENMRAEKIA